MAWQHDVGATLGTGERPATVSVTPFRVVDTRPAPDGPIGGAALPFGPDETRTYTIAGIGSVPSDATGVLVNITAVNATSGTFITAWPAGTTMPLASTLNPSPGAVSFNAAVVDLNGGDLSVFNKVGTVDVIIDVTGYLIDHDHDDRYLEQDEPIVITENLGGMRVLGLTPPVAFEFLGPVVSMSGSLANANKFAGYSLPLTQPASVGGTDFRLSSVEYCIRRVSSITDVMVDAVAVVSDNPDGAAFATVEVNDGVDRFTPGCIKLDMPSATARSHGLLMVVRLLGTATTGTVVVSGVRSTWVPVNSGDEAAAQSIAAGPTSDLLEQFPELAQAFGA